MTIEQFVSTLKQINLILNNFNCLSIVFLDVLNELLVLLLGVFEGVQDGCTGALKQECIPIHSCFIFVQWMGVLVKNSASLAFPYLDEVEVRAQFGKTFKLGYFQLYQNP